MPFGVHLPREFLADVYVRYSRHKLSTWGMCVCVCILHYTSLCWLKSLSCPSLSFKEGLTRQSSALHNGQSSSTGHVLSGTTPQWYGGTDHLQCLLHVRKTGM